MLLHVCYVLLRVSGWTKSKIISHQSAPSVASRPLGSPFPGLSSPIHPPTSPWTKAVGMRAVANAHRLNQFPHRIRILHLLHKGRSFKKFLKEGTGFVSHSARGAALGHYPWVHVPCEFPPHLLERKSCQRTLAFNSGLLHIKRVPSNKTSKELERWGFCMTEHSLKEWHAIVRKVKLTTQYSFHEAFHWVAASDIFYDWPFPGPKMNQAFSWTECNHYITTT